MKQLLLSLYDIEWLKILTSGDITDVHRYANASNLSQVERNYRLWQIVQSFKKDTFPAYQKELAGQLAAAKGGSFNCFDLPDLEVFEFDFVAGYGSLPPAIRELIKTFILTQPASVEKNIVANLVISADESKPKPRPDRFVTRLDQWYK